MRNQDSYSAIALFVLALAVGIQASRFPIGSLKSVGPGFLPLVLAVLLGFLSVALFVGSLRSGKGGSTFKWPERWLGMSMVLLAILAYGFFLKNIGFLFSTFLIAFVLFKYSDPGRWLRPLVEATATTIFNLLVFKIWLGIPLPTGLIGY
jgi:putative tricarboxylic transport membrane protein